MNIYKITNIINGDAYIGKTTKPIDVRFKTHLNNARRHEDTFLYRAVRKYGSSAFCIELIEETTDILLNEREKFWISEIQPKYNMTEGGDGGDTSNSPNYKNGMLNRPVHEKFLTSSRMTGRQHTEITKAKQSESRKKFWETIPDEKREARAQKLSGARNGASKSVVYNGQKYDTIKAAVAATGLTEYRIKKDGDFS